MNSRTRFLAAAITAASTLTVVSGCALTQSSKGSSGGGGSTGSSSSAAPVHIAYLTTSAANVWLAASAKAMAQDAAKQNVTITTFDAKFQVGVAAKQIQDVIASKKYQGIILATTDAAAVIPAVKQALKAGIKVVVLNQIVGTRLDTADPQVPGVSASVLAPPQATGARLGTLTVKACANIDPCRVVYMFGQKGLPFDDAVRKGFNSAISSHSGIKVIAEGQGGFLGTDQPRKATQDIIQAHPSFDVLVGSGDQQIQGALLALNQASMKNVKPIGVGGSEHAIAGIKAGTWWGDVAGAPITEGHQAFAAMMDAIRKHKNDGGIDVTTSLVDNGLITKANVDKFTAQWAG